MAGFLDDIIRNAGEYHQRAVDQAGEGISALDEMVNPTIPQQISNTAKDVYKDMKKELQAPGETVVEFKFGGETYQIEGNEEFQKLLEMFK